MCGNLTEDKKKSEASGVTDKTNKSAKLITDEISNVVLGKEQVIEMLMAGVLANGNILFEDYPGLAKTLIRTIILFSMSIIIFCAVQIGISFYFNNKPDIIMDLASEQKKANEKYITAQLLSSSLNRVYQIFIQNLILKNNEENNKASSLDFLNYLTDIQQKSNLVINTGLRKESMIDSDTLHDYPWVAMMP